MLIVGSGQTAHEPDGKQIHDVFNGAVATSDFLVHDGVEILSFVVNVRRTARTVAGKFCHLVKSYGRGRHRIIFCPDAESS